MLKRKQLTNLFASFSLCLQIFHFETLYLFHFQRTIFISLVITGFEVAYLNKTETMSPTSVAEPHHFAVSAPGKNFDAVPAPVSTVLLV
jgi:hypothetical protein